MLAEKKGRREFATSACARFIEDRLGVVVDCVWRDVEPARDLCARGAAEEKLTAYRKALFERIDEATAELITRYKEDPAAALSALPPVQ